VGTHEVNNTRSEHTQHYFFFLQQRAKEVD
jgi:hypothetical protein